MKLTRHSGKFTLSAIGLLVLATGAAMAAHVQWDFNGTLAPSAGTVNLVPGFAAPATTAGVTFTNTQIGGQSAQVAAFSRGTWFRLSHEFPPNGGGSYVNRYTLIIDVMFPSRPNGYAALFQTNQGNSNDGDWFINPGGGLGIDGNYGGLVPNGAWNRLVLVVDGTQGTLTSYLNGTLVQQNTGLAPDGRWSLDPTALLFADEDQENAAGFVNSVQLRDEAMLASDVAGLGGPSAAGIPLPQPPTLQVLSPNGGESFPAGSTQAVMWASANPSGLVQIDLWRGAAIDRTLGTVPMAQSNLWWFIYPRLGDSNNFRLRLSAVSFPAIEDLSDGTFSVFGSLPPANPLFGQALQNNGGFEQSLTHWQSIAGAPGAVTSAKGGAVPRTGARFFYGGSNAPATAVVRQDIDLIAAGFTTADIEGGAALDAEAWLRNFHGAGTFDDQVFYRVGFLDSMNVELSSLRCLVAGNNLWLQRALTGLLPPATRRLRLEIIGNHRRDADNDSLADDLIVRVQEAPLSITPAITKFPMLQDVRSNAMTLLWETDGNLCQHAIDWGRSNVAEQLLARIETLQIDSTHFVHRATLTGLDVETTYVYRVRSGASSTSVYAFRTAPRRDTPFAVAWWGDNHQGTNVLRQHVAHLVAQGADVVMVAGDMVNSGNNLAEWHNFWFKPLETANCAQTRPVIFARGNHDGEHALAYAYSALPGNESWFAFDYGNTRFIFLDSEVDTGASPEQFAWLQNELARPEARNAAFRVLCFHRPPYVDLWNGGGYDGEPFVRNNWVGLFAQYNVDLVICGHSHAYNRGSANGVTYVVAGGGGGILDTERVAFWPLFQPAQGGVEYSRYHYGLMEVDGCTLTWQTFDENNALLDLFTLPCRAADLSWQTSAPKGGQLPLVLSGRAGQTYVIEGSSNLTTWTPRATNTLPSIGPTLLTNQISLGPGQEFLRARTRP